MDLSRVLLVGLLPTLLMSPGCARKQERTQVPGPTITRVEIEGRADLSKEEVLEHISLRPSSWLGERYYYFPGADKVARARLRELYHSEGYYQVQVAPIEVEITRKDKALRRQRARVKIRIEAGPETKITEIRWRGLDEMHPQDETAKRSWAEISGVSEGQRFSVSGLNDAKAKLLAALRNAGYPDAVVHESALVNRTQRRAELEFEVEPGPRVVISGVQVQGPPSTPSKFVASLAREAEGQVYSPELISRIEAKIYALGIYGSVHTELARTSVVGQRELHIHLVERDPSQLALGVTAHFDPTIWSQRLGVRYQHNNLAQSLTRLKLSGSVGWAEMPVFSGKWYSSPILELDAHLSKPSTRDPRLRWFFQAQTMTQPREGYEMWKAQAQVGATRSLGEHASLSLGYHASYLSIYTFSDRRQSTTDATVRLEGNRPFTAYLQAQAQVFDLDRRVSPKKGVHGLLTYQWASRFLGSQSEYHRVVPELRGYLNPLRWLVIAARTRVGFILPFGQHPGARIDQRFFLGGVGSVRGWPLRTLSPFVTLCDEKQACVDVPFGGNSEFLANLEFRFNVWGDLDLVAFADAGDVQSRVFHVDPKAWMYTSGGGLRYVTPIGAIRLDVGAQINHDLARFQKTRAVAFHLALGDSF